KTRLEVVDGADGEGRGGLSTYNKTPSYGSQTPVYGLGSTTPMHDPSRSVRGGATPMHDPSKTPIGAGGSSVWDPSATPRATDMDEWDQNVSSSPAHTGGYLNPPTPGYTNPDTPQGGPFTPQTPGMYASSDHTYSPYQPTPSPSGVSYQGSAASPAGAGYMTPSPAGYSASGVTPSPSTFGYSPMTPGVPSPMFNPQTPGAGMENLNACEWQTTDIEVRIKDSHSDKDLIGQRGIIRGISGGMCAVFLLREDRVVNIVSDQLEPVLPEAGDRVKVIFGHRDDRELTGKLVSIDNYEGVVEIDRPDSTGSSDLRMFHLRYLCKMKN
ncbi:transcription elongation factor SPT5-like protein, partial [Dinothrombium tinctorium]